MSSNIQRLGDTLSGRMKRSAKEAIPTSIELGKILSNLSLITDSIKTPIPKGDYMINLTLISSTYQTSSETHNHTGGTHTQLMGTGHHTHDDGEHDHRLPPDFRELKSGDRVLVAWCGNEPVVIAIVVSS